MYIVITNQKLKIVFIFTIYTYSIDYTEALPSIPRDVKITTWEGKSDFYYYNIAHYGSLGTPCITMQGAPPGDWEFCYRYGSQ